MNNNIYSQIRIEKDSKKNSLVEFLKKECVLIISILLAAGSCFIATP